MTRDEMIAAIETEIARLEQVRELLRKSTSNRFGIAYPVNSVAAPTQKKSMSADARLRIAQAQKRRWARQKQAASAAEPAREEW